MDFSKISSVIVDSDRMAPLVIDAIALLASCHVVHLFSPEFIPRAFRGDDSPYLVSLSLRSYQGYIPST